MAEKDGKPLQNENEGYLVSAAKCSVVTYQRKFG